MKQPVRYSPGGLFHAGRRGGIICDKACLLRRKKAVLGLRHEGLLATCRISRRRCFLRRCPARAMAADWLIGIASGFLVPSFTIKLPDVAPKPPRPSSAARSSFTARNMYVVAAVVAALSAYLAWSMLSNEKVLSMPWLASSGFFLASTGVGGRLFIARIAKIHLSDA